MGSREMKWLSLTAILVMGALACDSVKNIVEAVV